MCCYVLDVSFRSKVRPKTLGCNAMGSALLFMFRPRGQIAVVLSWIWVYMND